MPEASTLGGAALAAVGFSILRSRWRAQKPVEQMHRRGRSLRSTPEVAAELGKKRRSGDPGLRWGRHMFPADLATRHCAFIGTTGSGKTLRPQ